MKPGKCYVCGAVLVGFLALSGFAAPTGPPRYVPRPDGRYDNNTYLVDPSRMDLSRIAASIVEVHAKTRFEMLNGGLIEIQREGSGVILSGGYLLTVEHVIAPGEPVLTTPLGTTRLPLRRKVSEEISFRWNGKSYPLRLLYANRGEDVALLEISSDARLPRFPYRLGDSDDLKMGNFVYVVGHPLSFEVNVREGIVSASRAPQQATTSGVKPEHTFMVSNGLVPGDSGSPIVAIRDGRFELVGISQGTVVGNTRLSWAIRINVIRDLLRAAGAIPPDGLPLPGSARQARAQGRIRGD